MEKTIKKEINNKETNDCKIMQEAIDSGFFEQPLGELIDFDVWYKEQLEEANKRKQKILTESKEEKEQREKEEEEELEKAWNSLSQEDKDWVEYMLNLKDDDSDKIWR